MDGLQLLFEIFTLTAIGSVCVIMIALVLAICAVEWD